MSQHTPTPWQIGKYKSVVSDSPVPEIIGSNDIYRYGGHMICESVTADNAAYIVKCVNNHVALVEALRSAVATIENYLAYEHNGDPWTEDARAMGEMDINDFSRDGRLDDAKDLLAAVGAP